MKSLEMISPPNENLNLLVRINFWNLFSYNSIKKLKNLLVKTKFYWSWAGGPAPVVIVIKLTFSEHSVINSLLYVQNICMHQFSCMEIKGLQWP